MWNNIFQKLIPKNFLVEISLPKNVQNGIIELTYDRGVKPSPFLVFCDFGLLLLKSQNIIFLREISDLGIPIFFSKKCKILI